MSSNDGTRPTDAHESLLAHHFFPVSLKLVDVPRRNISRRTLLVNQANDHGEITGSGIADSAAYDFKDRIEVIIDRKSGVDIDVERLNSYRGQLGAYRRRAGGSHGVGADDDGRDDSRVSQPRAARGAAFIDSTFAPMCTIGRFPGVPPCSRPLGAGGALIAARAS